MLIKADECTAGDRVRPLAGNGRAEDHSPAAGYPPTAEQQEIARLTAKLSELEAEKQQLDTDWRSNFDKRLSVESDRIAKQYLDDGEKRIAIIERELVLARQTFETECMGAVQKAALQLMMYTLARFAQERADDRAWVADVIAERIDRVGPSMLLALHLHPEDLANGGIIHSLADRLPARCEVKPDPSIQQGTAVLRLKLGQITIDPQKGLGAVFAALGDQDSDTDHTV